MQKKGRTAQFERSFPFKGVEEVGLLFELRPIAVLTKFSPFLVLGVGLELVIVAVLAGGLLKVMTENGALEYLISIMTKKIRSKRSCELTIAMLVSLVNICTANNTVAILTVGSISKRIGDSYGVDNRKSASILDSFSCCIQSILPYGAQILMATGLAAVSPIEILKYLYYPFVLFSVSVIAILIRYPKKYS